ncbi:MAG: adenylate kinase [Chloroflexi bacterium]|nr:adenylate kinase [Chloroflexota bacterium]
MPTYIVLLGPPGVGKGTQAKLIAETTGLPHVSSGDLFRENIKNETELGKLAQSFMNKGELVPDDVTISMIRDRLSRPDCKVGVLLDGFPRTTVQADSLASLLAEFDGKVNYVPYISASETTLIERLSGRWTCKAQGHVFHEKHNPPQRTGVCDFDGSQLYQRDDDRSETVSRRIQVYFAQTAPLIAYYRERGLLSEIDGAQPIEKVTADLLVVLRK